MKYIKSSKHRALLKSAAMGLSPALSIGKNSLTAEFLQSLSENIEKNELIKIQILKNCEDDPIELAETLAERSHSEIVQLIGRKIVLYKPTKEEKNRKYEAGTGRS